MSPRRKRRAIAVAKSAYHSVSTRRLEGTGVTANEHFVLVFLTVEIPWRKWAVRNLAAHLRGPWQRRAVRNMLARQPQRNLDKAGAEAVLTGLEHRGLLAGTTVTDAGRTLLAELDTLPQPPPRPRPLGLEASADPQLLADTRTVVADLAERTRKLRGTT